MKDYYSEYGGRGKDSLLHRNLRMCTEEGVFATPFVIMSVPGNFFLATLITQVLMISEGAYGFLVSLPAWFNALQVLYIPFLARYFSARSLTITTAFLNVLFWILLIFILPALAEMGGSVSGRWLILLFVFISLSQSIAGVSWMSWIMEWIPQRVRGKYFGRRNSIMGFTTVGFILLGGWVLETFGATVFGFQVLLGIVGGMRLVSVYLQTHIYTPWSRPEPLIHEGWLRRYANLAKHQVFFHFLVFSTFLAFWFNFAGPFIPIFLNEHLEFGIARTTMLLLLANIASAFAMPAWGVLTDRYGCKPVMAIGIILWMLSNYIWVFVTPQTSWILYPLWLWGGLTSGAVILGGFNLLLKLAPSESRTAGISVHLMTTSVASAIAPLIAGFTFELCRRAGVDLLLVFRVFFFIQPTAVLLSLLLLARVKEPSAQGISSVAGAFRTFRQVFIQNGLLMFSGINYFRSGKSKGRED